MHRTSSFCRPSSRNGWVTLSSYRLWSNTYTSEIIRVETADYYHPAGGACNNIDSYMVSAALSAEARQRIYATMLAAKLSARPIRARVDTTTCQDGRPKILNVMLD